MNWSFLWFLGEPCFVVPWYAMGALGALWVIYDLRVNNTMIKKAIGWGWPIIVFFFSVIGLALYFLTARAPGIGKLASQEEKQRMNWMMLKIGWKHGMGGMEGGKKKEVKGMPQRVGFITAMVALGFGALVIPAWLTHAREGRPIGEASRTEASQAAPGAPAPRSGSGLLEGVHSSLAVALEGLDQGNRTKASLAMDAAMRAAEVATHAAPGSFYHALEQIRWARLALQQGNEEASVKHLHLAARTLTPASNLAPPILGVQRYRGAKVLDPKGEIIGEVTGVSPNALGVALGGWRDSWGFIDFGARRHIDVPIGDVAFGPPQRVGMTLVAIPAQQSVIASK
jgi:hypothetical protein